MEQLWNTIDSISCIHGWLLLLVKAKVLQGREGDIELFLQSIMPILGGIDLLECKLEDNNHVGEVKQEIDMITRNANRLQKLAEDIVEVADIESSSFKIEVKMEDLCSMISNVICAMEKKYESDRKMISISFDSKNNIPNHDLLIAC